MISNPDIQGMLEEIIWTAEKDELKRTWAINNQ